MGIAPYVPGLPGFRAAKTANNKVVFRGAWYYDFLPAGKVISGTYSRDPSNTTTVLNLQPGLLMGMRTADSLYAPSILGVTTNAEAIGSTSIEADAAVVTELVRRVGSSGTFYLTGPPTTTGIVVTETVTYSAASGTTITCTAIVNAYIAGSFIQPNDGSEVPLTFIPDGYGIPVCEQDGTVLASIQFPQMPISGMVDSTQIVNWPTSSTSLQSWIIARLNGAGGGQFVFSVPRYQAS